MGDETPNFSDLMAAFLTPENIRDRVISASRLYERAYVALSDSEDGRRRRERGRFIDHATESLRYGASRYDTHRIGEWMRERDVRTRENSELQTPGSVLSGGEDGVSEDRSTGITRLYCNAE